MDTKLKNVCYIIVTRRISLYLRLNDQIFVESCYFKWQIEKHHQLA